MRPPSASPDLELVVTRVLDAPRALVFRVWKTPEHLMRWWGPKDFSTPSVETDFREGGAWRACIRSPDGTDYWQNGVYREIVEPERIVFSFRWEAEGALDTLITVTFEETADGKTRLTFRQAPFTSVAERDSHIEGWEECMDRLAAQVARTQGDAA